MRERTWQITRDDGKEVEITSQFWEVLDCGALWFYNQAELYTERHTQALFAPGTWRGMMQVK